MFLSKYLSQTNVFVYSVLSGILLYLGFTDFFFFLILIAFVPLLVLTQFYFSGKISGLKWILLVLLSFLIWNGLTTWWISLASVGGALMAIIANSILMCIVFITPFLLQKKWNKILNFWWLIPFWISFEYLHFHWDLMWPWLTLGNSFAFFPWIIQWYEITGTSGGTLWILVVNIIIANNILSEKTDKFFIRKLATVLLLPIIISLSIYFYRSKENYSSSHQLNVLVVQPNVDPYNDKFYIDPMIQVQSMYQQIKNYLSDSLDVILLPETFITENIYEGSSNEMLQFPTLKFMKDSILCKYPEISIITGANTIKFYGQNEKIPATARQNTEGIYYDVFNTALCIYKDSVQIYHKSKLVPGVEKMPYPALFKPLEKLAIDLGGTTGSLGNQDQPSLFLVKNQIPVATVICYESVFSEFVSQFFKIGAKALFVITNDGWWGNTPGYNQHLIFGRLRAIENRCYIARSANTGVSAVINPLGQIIHSTHFWEKDVFIAKIPLSEKTIIYSKIGDTISKISIMLLCLYFLANVFSKLKQ
ncbi:MAG: apolipoprotein N-acyltransferase [Bacteroidota bacterium]